MGQQADLNFRRAGVSIVLFVFFNEFFFGFCCIRQCSVLLEMIADCLYYLGSDIAMAR